MRRFLIHIVLLTGGFLSAQPALQHYGNMQLHDGAQMGLYTDLVNQAPFDQNLGLFGFYGTLPLQVSGDFSPRFFDVEIANDAGVDLEIPIDVANNLNFISGDFRTDRALSDIYVSLLQDAFTVGESNLSKVDGHVQAIQQQEVIFPVGDASQLRPLTYQPTSVVPVTKCAYFRDDPTNSPFIAFLDPDLRPRTIEEIGRTEFWRLEGAVSGTVTLTWNAQSNLGAIADDVSQIVIMGWNKSAGRWLPLSNAQASGDLTAGFVISDVFTPDDYVVLTFGSLSEAEEVFKLDNFYISPNGDGINDFLRIDELLNSPNNELRIYDRRGLLVFSQDNYTDQFNGFSNVDGMVINRGAGLPEGVYFYVVRLLDLDTEYQGFLYLQR
ncbi:gliding motility-associated C-terminal domain-containing protein [Robiginitalea sp. SC105]|uniref:gliding motility-associated C-terminal domain-containing protein n=1 Tax=Robiginitalea sp. SC105 TaxID=2762332 RepID=UPI00163B3F8A|nr:gliding motility-associated C-terminal domain-containing protein [Robiginitalea sp. SC105]MBC2839049.1 gliding motility-associated C-terminal domain-containing protein [Robiginitalea sp. SC105]